MLDFDLAALYEVATKALNQSVKRNIKRFPIDFMFQLNSVEWELLRSQVLAGSKDFVLRSQFVTSKKSENLDPTSLILKGVAEPGVLGVHDNHLNQIYDALENLLDKKAAQRSWEERERIGFKI